MENMRFSVLVLFAAGTGFATVRFPVQGVPENEF
jgi:hypothetical protein